MKPCQFFQTGTFAKFCDPTGKFCEPVRNADRPTAETQIGVLYFESQKQNPMSKTTTPNVPGVEIIDERDPSCRRVAGPFYEDQLEILERRCKNLQPREDFFISPAAAPWSIYRRLSK